jgi:general secretion pathway protein G
MMRLTVSIPFAVFVLFFAAAKADTPTTKPATRPTTAPAPKRSTSGPGAIARLLGARDARITAAGNDIVAIELALDTYETDVGAYPTSDQGLQALVEAPKGVPNWRGPYVKQIPVDPWGNPYVYVIPGKHNRRAFDLWSNGPDGIQGTADDVDNWRQK